jgi:hypothetical protein
VPTDAVLPDGRTPPLIEQGADDDWTFDEDHTGIHTDPIYRRRAVRQPSPAHWRQDRPLRKEQAVVAQGAVAAVSIAAPQLHAGSTYS